MAIEEMDDATKEFLNVEQCTECGHIAPREDFYPPEEISGQVSTVCPECNFADFD